MSRPVSLVRIAALLAAVLLTLSDAMPAEPSLLYSSSDYAQPCPAKKSLLVDVEGSTVTLELTESSREFLHASEKLSAGNICFYQGRVGGSDGHVATGKQSNGLFSATFYYNDRLYEIPAQAGDKDLYMAVHVPAPRDARTCGSSSVSHSAAAAVPKAEPELTRSRRAVLLDTNSAVASTDRKYIRLILVGDQYYYQKHGSNMTVAQSRLWEIGNYINAVYKQLGVNVIVVFTEVWSTDPYPTFSANNSAGANSTEMLNSFMDYKMRFYNNRAHSSAHLVSGLKMSGTDVGLAHLGRLCNFALGGGVNSDREANAFGVAVTVAHELGHNLGLNHDEDERGCACPDPQGCIMAAVGTDVNPLRFSNCSVFRYNDFAVDNGLGYCMSDPPSVAHVAATRATCGNRILEAGEDCDCGLSQWCNNTCCNPNTCKFTAGSTCASGECCDTANCKLKSQGVVCRPRARTCDLEEYCNGTSEWCPEFDDFLADGTACIPGQAYCYNGLCADRTTRCSVLFNGTTAGVYKAAPESYAISTIQGSSTGYCGYSMNSSTPLTYSFAACSPEDSRCGTLYCLPPSATAPDPVPIWKGTVLSDTKAFEGTINGTDVMATFIMLDMRSSGYRDPGMVPNGAECGTGRMCVDSQCVAFNASARCPNCNGKGSCAQSGQCFCQAGYRPPDCLLAGSGGSVTNHPPDTTASTAVTTPTTATTTPTTTATTPTLR